MKVKSHFYERLKFIFLQHNIVIHDIHSISHVGSDFVILL